MENNLYYKASKNMSLPGAFGLILGTALLGILLSVPYLWGIRMIPSVYLCILITVIFGGLLGASSSWLCKMLRIRNRTIAVGGVVIASLIYTYFKWVFFVSYTLTEGLGAGGSYFELVPKLLIQPGGFFEAILKINEVGTWSYGSNSEPVTGVVLALVWIVEILIIAILNITVMYEQPGLPYIDKENDWAQKKAGAFYLRFFPLKEMKAAIEADPRTILPYLDNAAVVAPINHVEIDLFHSIDASENYITLKEVTMQGGKKNGRQEKKVIEYLSVPKSLVDEMFTITGQR